MIGLGVLLVLLLIVGGTAVAITAAVRQHQQPQPSAARPDVGAARTAGTAAAPPAASAAGGPSIPALEPWLARWTGAGLLTPDEAGAIRAFEANAPTLGAQVTTRAPRPARRIPVVAEVLGYVGGVLALVGVVLLVAHYWTDLGTAGRVLLTAGASVVLFIAGWAVKEHEDPAFARLRGFLWLTGTATFTTFAFVMMHDAFGVESHSVAAFETSLAVAVATALLWWRQDRPLQQAAFLVAALTSAGLFVNTLTDNTGVVGIAVWLLAAVFVAGGLLGVRPHPVLTMAIGALGAMVGSIFVASQWQTMGLPLGTATAFALLAIALVPGLGRSFGHQLTAAVIGAFAFINLVPGTIGYFAQGGAGVTGLVVWGIGGALIAVSMTKYVRLGFLVGAFGSLAMIGGAALTWNWWHGFAPLFGIATALGLLAIGMLPRQILYSAFGSVGLLINVPWAIGWFFPGENRAPLLIVITGVLIIGVAVLLARRASRARHEAVIDITSDRTTDTHMAAPLR